ncbi:Cu(2+)-exporting ATPase protein [Dioscorea alata]|uniref:Cu(2+)-exporting ATPase protein n=1 Tax=Dioscorea alata TaxID=55571 RepID=A0ACB7U7B6_DIOAL|nr:Cu(2+)-exporting ATPase protein [Dioscorea alata]
MATLALPKITLHSISNPLTPGRSSLPIRFARSSSTCFGPLIGQISSLRSPAQRVPTPAAAVSGSSADGEPISTIGDLTLTVEGMMCDGCAASVKRILESQVRILDLRQFDCLLLLIVYDLLSLSEGRLQYHQLM